MKMEVVEALMGSFKCVDGDLECIQSIFSHCCYYRPASRLSIFVMYYSCKSIFVMYYVSFTDNVDTRTAMENIRELISSGNSYISLARSQQRQPNRTLLLNTASYITDLLRVRTISIWSVF